MSHSVTPWLTYGGAKTRYDTILMGNFMAYPEFQQKFGNYYGDEIGWQISGPWQTGLNMASTVGTIFGMQ